MTEDSWTGAQELFRAWPHVPPAAGTQGTVRRLRDALAGLPAHTANWRDIAGLTRQVLLEAQARENNSGLEIPIDPLLPTARQWQDNHCRTLPAPRGLRVTATPWHPPVPNGPAQEAAEEDLREIHRGPDAHHRRDLEPCPADPFLTYAMGYDYYVSVGQRQAARAVALAPPGSTTIICLPTGHGKTAVIQAPALLKSKRGGVSIVVVPTVVLALDLERRTQEVLSRTGRASSTGRYAYVGDLPDDVRAQMRDDIRRGRQRIVFTAPESLANSLKQAVGDAAQDGLLNYFIIDEAHLVEQWGNDFRPAYQTMASQWRAWLRRAPAGREPITVAMSATLTGHQVATLETLFSGTSPTRVVWAAQLRHEPSYYITACDGEQTRQAVVEQAVALLPKPLALYVSRVDDALSWVERLHSAGFTRVTAVTSASSSDERRAVMEGWSGRTAEGVVPTRYDIVVGTSAFGLGVDVQDVRSVVHACLPETVDRYYQEVGRGGRDGGPSIAYLVSAPEDQALAENLNNHAVITTKLAWERWVAMFGSRERLGGDRYQLSLDAYPDHLDETSELNRSWNIRTLNLMTRTGLVRLDIAEPPEQDEDESDAAWAQRRTTFYQSMAGHTDLTLLDSQVNDREHFHQRFAGQRTAIIRDQKSALTHLRAALRGDRCIGDVLGDYYRVRRTHGSLYVAITCRGCPHCRAGGPPPSSGFYRLGVEPRPPVPYTHALAVDPLAHYRGDLATLSLWWRRPDELRNTLGDLLEQLVRRGMAVVGGSGLDARVIARLQHDAAPKVVILDADRDLLHSYAGPVLWVITDTLSAEADDVTARIDSPDVMYLLHPRDLESPGRPGRLFADVHRANLPLRTALEAL